MTYLKPDLTYLTGDATKPIETGSHRVIAHVCNNIGAWGAGFSGAISRRWPEPEEHFRNTYKSYRYNVGLMPVGMTYFVDVEDELTVANMVAQRGIRKSGGGKQNLLDEKALADCLLLLNLYAVAMDATVHMPKIGSGLAGGDWSVVESLIEEAMVQPTFVYELKGNNR